MALAANNPQHTQWTTHWRWLALGLGGLALIIGLQPPGQIATDTKLDLLIDPWGFLSQALWAYSPDFPLGQLQNQAYGYLFPHGLFFGLTEPLPSWIAQRLWWFLVLATGFIGTFLLARRLGLSPAAALLAAWAYSLSPRTLSTLTTISSETWPTMLVPWTLLPLYRREQLHWRHGALAALPVATMGAVNATATIAACGAAALVLGYRYLTNSTNRRGTAAATFSYALCCLLLSAWWLIPLLVLGRYSPPFTDYIESAAVTTRWLNPAEVLRGTTSWAPFVDSERSAGVLLVTEPVFILATMALAAVGLCGLRRLPREFSVLLVAGLIILCWDASWYLSFLDGAGAAARNLHKWDPWVRLPLALGIGAIATATTNGTATTTRAAARTTTRAAGNLLLALVLIGTAPAWSGRLLPQGTWTQLPQYWLDAAAYSNATATGRVLIYPHTPFARQEWGWTRDEPAQPLLDVPWAVRDAIPLVNPEAIRGLDGIYAALDQGNTEPAARAGISTIILRGDLDGGPRLAALPPLPGQTFGPLRVHHIAGAQSWYLAPQLSPVAGGGEVLSVLPPGAYQLVDSTTQPAEIISDTPLLVDRNFGAPDLSRAVSAPRAATEASRTWNRVADYPSIGALTQVIDRNGQVRASSSAADATVFGAPDPARSATAAVDGRNDTAWYPAPGDSAPWIGLHSSPPWHGQQLQLRATADSTVQLVIVAATTEDQLKTAPPLHHQSVQLKAGRTQQLPLPADGTALRIELEPGAGEVGIAELALSPGPTPQRPVVLPPAPPTTRGIVLQQLFAATGSLDREFTLTAPLEATVEITGAEAVTIDGTDYQAGDSVSLGAGTHELRSTAHLVRLIDPAWSPPALLPTGAEIAAAAEQRVLISDRAALPGLAATMAGRQLEPVTVGAGMQGFIIPAGVGGTVHWSFAGDKPYRLGLAWGGLIALLSCVVIVVGPLRQLRRNPPAALPPQLGDCPPASRWWLWAAVAVAGGSSGVGLLAVALSWAISRLTSLSAPVLSAICLGSAAAMLARAPWPSPLYAGDSALVAVLCLIAVAASTGCSMKR